MSKAVIRVVAAVIEHDGRYLITQRNATAVLPLLWEFPGGRVEPGETDEAALSREVRHRIGVAVTIGGKVGEHVHDYSRYEVHMVMFACALPDGAVPYPATTGCSWMPRRSRVRRRSGMPASRTTAAA